eukprot:jgi/Mesvir1/11853/Mv00202-RA.1
MPAGLQTVAPAIDFSAISTNPARMKKVIEMFEELDGEGAKFNVRHISTNNDRLWSAGELYRWFKRTSATSHPAYPTGTTTAPPMGSAFARGTAYVTEWNTSYPRGGLKARHVARQPPNVCWFCVTTASRRLIRSSISNSVTSILHHHGSGGVSPPDDRLESALEAASSVSQGE